jgi:hypothetical protein
VLWLSLRFCLVIWTVPDVGRAALMRYTLIVVKCRFSRVSLCEPVASGSVVAENSICIIPKPVTGFPSPLFLASRSLQELFDETKNKSLYEKAKVFYQIIQRHTLFGF